MNCVGLCFPSLKSFQTRPQQVGIALGDTLSVPWKHAFDGRLRLNKRSIDDEIVRQAALPLFFV